MKRCFPGLAAIALAACVGDEPSTAATPVDGGSDSAVADAATGADVTDASADTTPASDADAPGCLPPASGMISWWTGDSTFADKLATNNLSVGGGGAVTYAPGHVGFALKLDRTAFLEQAAPNNLNGLTALTIEGWVYRDAQADERILDRSTAGANDGWVFDVFVTKLRLFLGVVSLSSNAAMPIGVMTHVAGTNDGQNLRLYINGVEDNALTGVTAPVPSPNLPLRLGATSNTSSRFSGLVDELAIYSRALTAAEIKAIYDAGSKGRCK